MVSEFVVVWVELNWLRDVAGSVFFVKRDARQACVLRCFVVELCWNFWMDFV